MRRLSTHSTVRDTILKQLLHFDAESREKTSDNHENRKSPTLESTVAASYISESPLAMISSRYDRAGCMNHET